MDDEQGSGLVGDPELNVLVSVLAKRVDEDDVRPLIFVTSGASWSDFRWQTAKHLSGLTREFGIWLVTDKLSSAVVMESLRNEAGRNSSSRSCLYNDARFRCPDEGIEKLSDFELDCHLIPLEKVTLERIGVRELLELSARHPPFVRHPFTS
jgi:hypothetical protein